MVGLLLIAIGVIILVAVIWEFNKFVDLKNKIKQSKSTIDVYLTQRFDLIPNLVACTKGYMEHESETFAKISIMRIKYAKDKDLDVGKELNSNFLRIMAIGENYPDLKASDHFRFLQQNLIKIESQLQAARRVYNGDVTLYNTAISVFPAVIVAKIFGFKEKELFEIEEYKKENVNIDV